MKKGKFLTITGLSLIGVIFIAAVFAPFITHLDPTNMILKDRFLFPSLTHPMGTDQNLSLIHI